MLLLSAKLLLWYFCSIGTYNGNLLNADYGWSHLCTKEKLYIFYIVLTGYEDWKIRINDSNSHANSERLWTYEEMQDQICNLWVIR